MIKNVASIEVNKMEGFENRPLFFVYAPPLKGVRKSKRTELQPPYANPIYSCRRGSVGPRIDVTSVPLTPDGVWFWARDVAGVWG